MVVYSIKGGENMEKQECTLLDYYKNVFWKANVTFFISCLGAIAGVVIIFVSIINNNFTGYSLISSIIIEAVSSLLFVLEDRMRKTAHDTMTYMRLDNNNLYCEKMLDKIQDKTIMDQAILEMIEVIIGVKQ